MMLSIPQGSGLSDHLSNRMAEAVAIGLVDQNHHKDLTKALFCVPPYWSKETALRADPNLPIQETKNVKGWTARQDLFDECVLWLVSRYSETSCILVCEAGLSKVGDQVLENRPHIILNSTPMLWGKIQNGNQKQLSQILRWSRAITLLGVVSQCKSEEPHGITPELFICDVFDGDSLILCPLTITK